MSAGTQIVSVTLRLTGPAAPCIRLIRNFDPTLPMGELACRIRQGRPAFSFDLYYYDVVEDLEGIDRKDQFRRLLDQLMEQGAQLTLTLEGEPISLEFLDNRLQMFREIAAETERLMDLEAEE